jgi:dipeptidase
MYLSKAKIYKSFLGILLVFVLAVQGFACTTIIVGKDLTKNGTVLMGHNEELGDYSAQHYVYRPAALHEKGTILKTPNAEVPQVEKTFAYNATIIFDKTYIPGEITSGMNENFVVIGNNLAYQRDDVRPWPSEGRMIWTDYAQIALERAKTAREAVQIIGDLAQEYKHWGPGTMFGIADPNEGWFIEITQEGQWVAERVPDDGVGVRANTYRIRVVDFDAPERFMFSPDLVQYAEEKGWYSPSEGDFDFQKIYADPERAANPYNERRHWRVETVLGEKTSPITAKDLQDLLRDHYEGTEYDLTGGYASGSPLETPERTIDRLQTEVSVVFELRSSLPVGLGGLSWRAMGTPSTSVYIPWYFASTDIPKEYQTGTNELTPESAYWAFRTLSEKVNANYGERIAPVKKAWREFEERHYGYRRDLEKLSAKIYERDPEMAKALLAKYTSFLAEKALHEAEDLTASLQ